MTYVKICGLTNLEDARHAARCGADLLGFIFVASSPRYVELEQARAIIAALRAEGRRAFTVGVFADQPAPVIREAVSRCGLDRVQLHGQETPEDFSELDVPVIRAAHVRARVRARVPWEDLLAWRAWAYLLDAYDPQRLGGTGQTWRWELLGDRPPDAERILVAGGLTPDNVAQAIRQARPWGVDVSSGVEAAPGRKDPALVERFICTVRKESER